MTYDLFIIGGGINGTAIARDASGRGLSIFLAEKDDLASGTSSASTKLIHGGLRYLEYYEFRLVREALIEREVLLNAAPHIIWPLRFVLPHHAGLRPRWLIRLGLFMYDHLGGRKILPPTRSINFAKDETGKPLREEFTHGWEYSDCWVNDARLVALYAMDAKQKGAEIRTRTKVTHAERKAGGWELAIEKDGKAETIQAKFLINAAGPWVGDVLSNVVHQSEAAKVRMVKGSHIVVDRIYTHDKCYIFQNADGRIDFAIPYEGKFTLIGTTDLDYQGKPGRPDISAEETDYLLHSVQAYFNRKISKESIRWSYSGIRPLYDDGASAAQSATRDYVLKVEGNPGEAAMLSVFGGKITTSRKLAEAALQKLAPFFPTMKKPWTAKAQLPGGLPYAQVGSYLAAQQKKYSFLKPANVERMFRSYGTKMEEILGEARFGSELGPMIGPLSEREIEYLKREEFVVTADDILWRRSKLGLHMKPDEIEALKAYLAPKAAAKPAAKATSKAPAKKAKKPVS
ncbi:glycerol-3-phosphate dehydrogenase [Aestuariivirga litoralis]|uniref:glycerol-3-phosphate dehydrogenase n=1 Tax=Aestuariivirga litoralis TaxID=2650924 RepID=UPI001FED7A8A|nr:glycerol-3-phosphate dehydrogenase [Aestuariivirga litoralis]